MRYFDQVRRRSLRLLAVFVPVCLAALITASSASAIKADIFRVGIHDPAGTAVRQAGSHPDVTVSFRVERVDPANENAQRIEQPRRVWVKLPPGIVGDALTMPTCPEGNLKLAQGGNAALCPPETQVGIARVPNGFSTSNAGVYNIETDGSQPAMFAFTFLGVPVKLIPEVRAGDFGITMDSGEINQGARIAGADVTLWGVPQDPVHNPLRFNPGTIAGNNPNPNPRQAFLSMPTRCGSSADEFHLTVHGWNTPGEVAELSTNADVNDNPFIFTGCDAVPFVATLEVGSTSRATDSPSGLEVDLRVPQNRNPDGLAAAHVKDVAMTLPEGFSVSPASAAGLGACSPAEIDIDSNAVPNCPDTSKLGTVLVDTPLLNEPLPGAIYLANPNQNPFGSLISLYLVVSGQGVTLKLPGRVDPDPQTGQLTATFTNNPQLPFDRLQVRFDSGSNASLTTPTECGRYETKTTITSWSGKAVELTSPLIIDQACEPRGFSPSFQAGMVDPTAGGSSPFSLAGARGATDEVMRTVREIKLPEGLLGRVGDVELCDGAQAAAGTCPAVSQVGQVQVAAGAGPAPLWVPEAGKAPTSVSLTGPYNGAPYGLSIVVPAQAGPFDLGRVVVRSALHVNERTAQLTTGVDESRVYNAAGGLVQVLEGQMPQILEGIPLNLRELRVIVDREGFMVNPTNCTQKQSTAQAVSITDQTADLASRFRASDCARLDFAPRFNTRILDTGRRSTLRSFNPRVRFVVAPRQGHANIGRAAVTLPPSVILDQGNIRTVCTRAQFAERNCPEGSIYGHARAWSPLLRRPVQGPVYLGSSTNQLPDLIADLDGEVRIVLQGRIDTARGGRIRNTFETVPDAPVSRFVLQMRGGNRGILVISTDLCRSNARGVANFTGQNGKRSTTRPPIGLTYRGCTQVRRQATRKQAARKSAATRSAARS